MTAVAATLLLPPTAAGEKPDSAGSASEPWGLIERKTIHGGR